MLAREDSPGDKRLVAYVHRRGRDCRGQDLRAHLATSLPDYMVPAAFVRLEALPLTPNGKLDRRALPAPEATPSASATTRPRKAKSKPLAAIWAEVLHIERVGVHDNFFELGGHSLLAVQLASRIRSQLGVEVPLSELFAQPTLQTSPCASAPRRASALPDIEIAKRGAPLPLSFAQERLWFLAQLDPGRAGLHVPGGVRLRVRWTPPRWSRPRPDRRPPRGAAHQLSTVDGARASSSNARARFALAITISRPSAIAEAEPRAPRPRRGRGPFDLERGPLVRAAWLRLAGRSTCCWSPCTTSSPTAGRWACCRRVQRPLRRVQPGPACSPAAAADPVRRLRRLAARSDLRGEVLRRQLAYWSEQLAGAAALLELPTDRPRPAVRDLPAARPRHRPRPGAARRAQAR